MKEKTANILKKTRRTIDLLNNNRQAIVPALCSEVKEVVVIASSSRGGSSIFSEILRHSPELLHFKGEINPFLTLAGLSYPHSGRQSDLLDDTDGRPDNIYNINRFEQEMALDVGISHEVDLNDPVMLNRFIHDLQWRLCVQWPELDLNLDTIANAISRTLALLNQQHGWQHGTFKDPQLFHVLLLASLHQKYKEINPYYYDLRPDLIEKYCPEAVRDFSPPASCIIEEPPFVPIVPRGYITLDMARNMPLIFKTPSNVYRLPFLRKVFSKARFRILHLVRNPADSINGLVDGWLYNGFFSHKLPAILNIKGYSDLFPDWGKKWWKYDLPPGWQELTNRPIEYICGYQWASAHREIINYIATSKTDFLRINFEDIIGSTSCRRQVFSHIAQWLSIEGREIIDAAVTDNLTLVMATSTQIPPRKRRWFEKAALIKPVLADPDMNISALAELFGYQIDE